MWTFFSILLLFVLLACGWVLTLLCLPGTWLIVASAACYAWWGPATGRLDVGATTIIVLLVLAALGEVLEFALSAVTARSAGGSRRAAVGAIGGSLLGAMVGLFLGIPVPVLGSILSAVLFAAGGAMAGAFLMQRSMPDPAEALKAWRIGKAAFWGRLGGTFAKLAVATVMVVVCSLALIIR